MPRGSVPPARLESSRRVRAARAWSGLDRQSLAERIAIDRYALLALETGRQPLTPELCGRLATSCHVPTWFLLDGFEGRPS